MQGARHKEVEEVIQDQDGRILGRYSARRSATQEEIRFMRCLLLKISKQKQGVIATMSANVKVNLVKLAGAVKSIKADREDSGFVLVDSQTKDSRYIACTIYQSADLVKKLKTFQNDDYIQVVGFIRSWSKKIEGDGGTSYENKTEVRITEIKNMGTAKASNVTKRNVSDDDVPF